jgi:PAS domain S-box-containing protein
MDLIHQMFYRNLDVVFFIYGLAFIIMGITVLVQPKKGSEFRIANILWLLGFFGITHGINEILDMWAIIKGRNPGLDLIRWFILIISYIALFEFGRRLFCISLLRFQDKDSKSSFLLGWWMLFIIGGVILGAGLLSSDFWKNGSIWTRYLLGLPGGILIGFGFSRYYKSEIDTLRPLKVKKYFMLLSSAFIIYGILGGTVVPKGNFFPANWLNTESFLFNVKIPVQVFRAICALTAAWAVGGMLKIFNWEIRSKLKEAQAILKQQLKESEERYMEIVESSTDIIHSIDTDEFIVCSNTHGCELLGYSRGELVGKHIRDIYTPETWLDIKNAIKKVRREGSVFIDEGRIIKKNGEEMYVAIHCIGMYDNNRNFLGARLTVKDITERKRTEQALRESEERYRLLFEESRDAIFITSREGKFIDINQSALDLFGYTKEDIISLTVNDLYVNPDEKAVYHETIEQKGFVRDYSVKFRKKDGTEIECLLTSSVKRDNNGNIIGYQGIIRDITERKKIEEERLKLEKLESVGILAGGIAHDFNNILTTIVGNISLTKMFVNSDKKATEILEDAERACLRAKDLTKQLLTFSKGGTPIKKVLSINELLKDSTIFSLRGSNIKYHFSIPEDLWTVEIDEGQIGQVINNLIINAKQAMPSGGSIYITGENITINEDTPIPLPEGDYIKISIKDEGIGIPEENINKIFDPYFTTKESGSGLGLTTTYSILKNHGGYISVESFPDNGTTFYIYLPAFREKQPKKRRKTDTIHKGEGKILLMEDEVSIQKTVSKVLRQIGYEVDVAKDGSEAIEIYKKSKESYKPFDVVIMDLTIRGGMGGKEAIKKLLEIDPDVKAIVSSGYFNDPIMADYKKYGFSGVISKPYEIGELDSLLRSIIKGDY